MEEINYLKEHILKDMKMLPPFVKTNDLIHRACYEMSKNILGKFYLLVSVKILTKNKINTINTNINEDLREMFDLEPKISILYFEYYRDLLLGYMLYAIDYELWETCANIRNLHELLYGEKMILENE